MKKKRIGFYVKALISIILLYYVFHKVGWERLWLEVKQADLYYLILYVCIAAFMTFVSAVKWSALVKSQGMDVSLSRLFWLYMVGYFFNNILPTSVGGDVVRAYELGKVEGKNHEAMASVFMERFTGLTILIIFALLAVLLDRRFLTDIRIMGALGTAVIGYLVIMAVVFNRSLLVFMQAHLPYTIVEKVLKKAQKFQDAIYLYKHRKRDIMYAMVYSVVFYVCSVLIVHVGCMVFNTEVPLGSLLSAVPIMLVIFMIPISLGGIGLHEWAYYFVLGMVGVPGPVSLSLGLLYRARTVVFGLLGGAMYPLISSRTKHGSRDVITQSAGGGRLPSIAAIDE